jgi:putative inorganic carbon (hco3(-)) transporter
MNGIMTARLFDARGLPLVAGALGAIAVGFASSRSPLLTIVALAAVVLIIFVLTQPHTVLMIMLAVLPWEGMLGFPTQSLTVVKILGFLLLVSVTLSAIAQGTRLRAPPAAIAAFALVLFATISLLASHDPAAGISKLLRYALFAGFFFIAIQLLDSRARLLAALKVFIASGGAAAVWGLVSFLSGHTTLARGPISEPLEFGYMLATMLPMCLYLILEDRKLRFLWLACFLAILAATLATLSRGAFVGLVVMLIWAVLTGRIRLKGLLTAAIGLVALVAVGFSLFGPVINESVSLKGQVAKNNELSRLTLWHGAIEMAMDRPITGIGTGQFGEQSVNYVLDDPIVLPNPQTHNAYLEILAESGVFALAAFLFFLGSSYLTLARVRRASRERNSREGERLANALQAALVVAIAGALFLSEQIANPFWVICAFGAVLPLATGTAVDRGTLAQGIQSATPWGAARGPAATSAT